MTERTLRETVAGMKAAAHYQTEFHRGWNGALEAVAALLDAHTAAQPAPSAAPTDIHPDDLAVDRFAAAMKAKMAKSRAKGRNGWEGDLCTDQFLAEMLIGHLSKGNAGNFEDIANLAMMLHQRGADPAVLREIQEGLARVMQSAKADADIIEAQAAELARLREGYSKIEEAGLGGYLTPELVAQITRAALTQPTGD